MVLNGNTKLVLKNKVQVFQRVRSICTDQRSHFHVNPLHPSAEDNSGHIVDISIYDQNTIISIPCASSPCQNEHLWYSQ